MLRDKKKTCWNDKKLIFACADDYKLAQIQLMFAEQRRGPFARVTNNIK